MGVLGALRRDESKQSLRLTAGSEGRCEGVCMRVYV